LKASVDTRQYVKYLDEKGFTNHPAL